MIQIGFAAHYLSLDLEFLTRMLIRSKSEGNMQKLAEVVVEAKRQATTSPVF